MNGLNPPTRKSNRPLQMMEQIARVYSAALLPSTERTLQRRCLLNYSLFLVPDATQNRKFWGGASFDKEPENAKYGARGVGIVHVLVSRYKTKEPTTSVWLLMSGSRLEAWTF
jgi:hypothetical protein